MTVIAILISFTSLLLSIAALLFARSSFAKSHKIEERQLEIEEARRQEEQEAYLTCQFYYDGRRRVLRITNKGNGEARNISLFLDGQPINEHPCWAGNQNAITVIGGQNYADYIVALTRGTIPSNAEIHWDDDVKSDNVSRSSLTL